MATPVHKVTVKLAEPVVRRAFAPYCRLTNVARGPATRAITAALQTAFPDITRANMAFLWTRIRINGLPLRGAKGKREKLRA